MAYQLHYWPTVQGRGEFVRLALEAAGAPYTDVARGAADSGMGESEMLRFMGDEALTHPPFAPPFLKDGAVLVAQTAAILHYLAPTLKQGAVAALQLHQLLDLFAKLSFVRGAIQSLGEFDDARLETGFGCLELIDVGPSPGFDGFEKLAFVDDEILAQQRQGDGLPDLP